MMLRRVFPNPRFPIWRRLGNATGFLSTNVAFLPIDFKEIMPGATPRSKSDVCDRQQMSDPHISPSARCGAPAEALINVHTIRRRRLLL